MNRHIDFFARFSIIQSIIKIKPYVIDLFDVLLIIEDAKYKVNFEIKITILEESLLCVSLMEAAVSAQTLAQTIDF